MFNLNARSKKYIYLLILSIYYFGCPVCFAEALGVSQQTITSYEVARRRIPVSALPVLARLLAISVDELLGEPARKTNGKRGPTPKLQQQMERVSLLPRAKQKFVSDMIDTVIQQAS